MHTYNSNLKSVTIKYKNLINLITFFEFKNVLICDYLFLKYTTYYNFSLK